MTRLIDVICDNTDVNIDVADNQGIIRESNDSSKVGKLDPELLDFIKSEGKVFMRSDGMDGQIMTSRYMLGLTVDGKKAGAVGLSGRTDDLKVVSLVVKQALEYEMEVASKYEKLKVYRNSMDLFTQTLLYDEHMSPEVLEARASKLGFDTAALRIPIFFVMNPRIDPSDLLERNPENPFSHKEDILAKTRSGRMVVFKYLGQGNGQPEILQNYRRDIKEYVAWWENEISSLNCSVIFHVGTMQNRLHRYKEAYQHAVWMETTARLKNKINWFYDNIELYVRSMVSSEIYDTVFGAMMEQVSLQKIGFAEELIEAMDRNNYNFRSASQELFIHKNTVSFRMEKLKQLFEINPVQETKDRDFLSCMRYYLKGLRNKGSDKK